TGRKLTVGGDLSLSLLPNLAVDMSDVRFANTEDSDVDDMMSLAELKVELKILPLLSGAVEVSRFVLVEPEIYLEVDAQGRPNWELEGAGSADSGTEATGTQESGSGETAEGDSGGLPISELKLGDIRLESGKLTFVDHSAGTEEILEAINMELSLEDIQSPFEASGSLDYKGETINLDFGLTNLHQVLEGGSAGLKLGVVSDPMTLGFTGNLNNQGAPSTAGRIDLSISSIRKLAAWLAEPIEFEGQGLEALTIASQLNASAERVAFTDATLTLDQIQGKGEVTADLGGAIPKIGGRLALGAVDLNPYMPPSSATTQGTGEDAGEAVNTPAGSDGETASADWSDEPIAMPALGGLDLQFELSLDSLKVQEVQLERTVLALNMAGQELTAELKEFALYDGRGSGSLKIATADGQARIEERFSLTGLQALPFLKDAADFDRLEGTANAEFALTTTGATERQLMQNLSGDGKVVFADGAVVGINIASMVRNVGTAFLSAEANETRKTDFAELSGSFTIEQGIVRNDDLKLQAPALRIGGSGTVDLPSRFVDYRIDPKAAATLEGQGSEQDVAGVLVPVIVKGPFDNLSYAPDLGNLVDQAIKDPEGLAKQVKQQGKDLEKAGRGIRDQLKNLDKDNSQDLLEGLTKGDDNGGGSPAGKLLDGLLGN
ncbi:MAG: AsmA family protein, partial [Geminicoccaceae bacterium]